jgi:hypothetical protein
MTRVCSLWKASAVYDRTLDDRSHCRRAAAYRQSHRPPVCPSHDTARILSYQWVPTRIAWWRGHRLTVSLNAIAFVAGRCGYYTGQIACRLVQACAVYVATERGRVERPQHRHPPRLSSPRPCGSVTAGVEGVPKMLICYPCDEEYERQSNPHMVDGNQHDKPRHDILAISGNLRRLDFQRGTRIGSVPITRYRVKQTSTAAQRPRIIPSVITSYTHHRSGFI